MNLIVEEIETGKTYYYWSEIKLVDQLHYIQVKNHIKGEFSHEELQN